MVHRLPVSRQNSRNVHDFVRISKEHSYIGFRSPPSLQKMANAASVMVVMAGYSIPCPVTAFREGDGAKSGGEAGVDCHSPLMGEVSYIALVLRYDPSGLLVFHYRHEIVGIAIEVGCNVQKFKVGDKVGVGCLVNSCRTCESCNENLENYCPKMILTYGATDIDGTITYEGYSSSVVMNEHFIVRIPENTTLGKGAPLLCAGITVYSPMKNFGLNVPEKHLGVVGLGGLGHVAVKFGKAFGMKVTVISSSPSKEKKEAVERLGADSFLVSCDPEQMRAAMRTMEGIISTVSATHQLAPWIFLLKAHGKMIMVERYWRVAVLEDTQEMIDLSGKHGITADIELISMDYVNTAMELLVKSDVRYLFVIDVANTLKTKN